MPSEKPLNFFVYKDVDIQTQDLEDKINSVTPWIDFFIKQMEKIDIGNQYNIDNMKIRLEKIKKKSHKTSSQEIDSILLDIFTFINKNKKEPVIIWLNKCKEKYFDLTYYDYERSFSNLSETWRDVFDRVLNDCEMVFQQDFGDEKNQERLLNFLDNQKKLIELQSQKDEKFTQVFRKNVYTLIGLVILLLVLSIVFPPAAFSVVIGVGALSLGYINFDFFNNSKQIDKKLNECKALDKQFKQQIISKTIVTGSTTQITQGVGQGRLPSKLDKSSNSQSQRTDGLFSSENPEQSIQPNTKRKSHL